MKNTPDPSGHSGRVVVVGNLTIDDVVLADGTTLMATLGGNSVHTAAAAAACGAPVALVARRGEDFPADAFTRLQTAGVDTTGVVDIPGPTVRNWVIYEPDGRRHWVYRTPAIRSAEVAPLPADVAATARDARVVHVAAMPLANAEAVVDQVRRTTPDALVTLDTHEGWADEPPTRVLALAASVDLFEPSLEELQALTGDATATGGLRALANAGVRHAVVKAGADGAYALAAEAIVHIPALQTPVVDTTGAGDSFCGGVAAGLARGLETLPAVGLGVAAAGTAITSSGSLRLLDHDTELLLEMGRDRTARASAVPPAPPRVADPTTGREGPRDEAAYDIEVMRREIEMIPDVVSDVLDDTDGHIRRLGRALVDREVEHLWLTGCGDSAFAGHAAALAFQRHTGITAHPVHALDLARYLPRALPKASAVVCVSFSGKVGRTTEAAIQARRFGHPVFALTNTADSQLGRAVDEVVPLEVTTLGFSPGTSTYVAMLGSLLRLAAEVAAHRGQDGTLGRALVRLPASVADTLELTRPVAADSARLMLAAPWTTFLGAGPNEATAKFGAAKLFEGPQRLAVSTNLEEWAHEEYFVTSPGDPVVLVNPTGAGHNRGVEILSELRFIGATPVVVSDAEPDRRLPGELWLPLAPDVTEELSPVTAALPLSLVGFHLAQLVGKQSYNFPSEAARTEHYQTIHRATIGEPA
ncbi:MAG: SIS domain-containing protein [Nocardioides sp.]|nr:SIS domain-containing protein [Nocardioides sp.]